jgi:hypothetical protein
VLDEPCVPPRPGVAVTTPADAVPLLELPELPLLGLLLPDPLLLLPLDDPLLGPVPAV